MVDYGLKGFETCQTTGTTPGATINFESNAEEEIFDRYDMTDELERWKGGPQNHSKSGDVKTLLLHHQHVW